MSEPGAPPPTPPVDPHRSPAPPPSYGEFRAGPQQPHPQQHPYGGYLQRPYPQHPPQHPYGAYPQPPYGPPNPWQYQPPPERVPGTNGFAVAALVFGIIGGIPLAIAF